MVERKYIVTLAYGALSEAELESYFTLSNLNFKVVGKVGRCCILKGENLSSDFWLGLGGLHKVAEVFAEVKEDEVHKLNLDELIASAKDKMKWAVSTYSESEASALKFSEDLQGCIKEALKSKGVVKTKLLRGKIRKVDSGWEYEVSSQLIQGERVVEEGFEAVAVKLKDWLIGKSIAVVDHIGYRERDLGRPVQDPTITMPPKLARILVNLTACSKGETLLDPFCGLGTILGEAIIRGLDIVGVDSESSRVEGARKNLTWLLKKYGIRSKVELFQGYAENLSRILKGRLVDGVATEPILLPPLKHPPTDEEAKRMLERSSRIYCRSLPSISKHLKPKGRLAIVLPCVKTKSRRILSFDISREASKAGLRLYSMDSVKKYPLLVGDPSQMVMRGFYIFEKVGG
ncbi:MAG: DNA methyltransferase [Nitrososphaerales archaeon]